MTNHDSDNKPLLSTITNSEPEPKASHVAGITNEDYGATADTDPSCSDDESCDKDTTAPSSSTNMLVSSASSHHSLDSTLNYDQYLNSSSTLIARKLVPKLKESLIQDSDIPTIKKRRGNKVAEFYINQNNLIRSMLQVHQAVSQEDLERQALDSKMQQSKVMYSIRISVVGNIALTFIQMYAALSSGSLSLFATMADAMMDLLSSIILLLASIAAEQQDTHRKYPSGRSRIETVGIIIFASLMGAFSTGLLMEGIQSLLSPYHEPNSFNILNGMCIVLALVIKLALFLYCFSLRHNHSAHILMLDHRNDLIVNSFGLAMAFMGRYMYDWIDPLGCLIIAIIILRSWIREAWEQMQLIVGISADPQFLQLLTYIAMTHHSLITHVDTVRAYHSGARLFVEVDIVMSPETPLRIIHDVAETLQNRYERMDHVERAFVHVDYECLHRPEHSSGLNK